MPSTALPAECQAALLQTLSSHPQVERAVLFGSRAKGTHKSHSDIDISVYGHLDMLDVEHIISDLDEEPTIYKYDVVAYHQIRNPRLKDHIDRVGIPVYQRVAD